MEYRQLGGSGLKVPVLSFGAATFGGGTEFFKAWGETDVAEASRLVDICFEAGVNMFDTADIYSKGLSEEVLGEAIKGRRDKVLISTKGTFPMGDGANELGSSSYYLTRAIEAELKTAKTDYIDIYTMHGFDALTPVEETLQTLNNFIESGKVRYIAASNFSGWHLMKSLAASDTRLVALCRASGLLFADRARIRMGIDAAGARPKSRDNCLEPARLGPTDGQNPARRSRCRKRAGCIDTAEQGPPVADETLYNIVDVLDEVAEEVGKTVPQVALNWLLQRPRSQT